MERKKKAIRNKRTIFFYFFPYNKDKLREIRKNTRTRLRKVLETHTTHY